MKVISKKFEEVWKKAEKRNREEGFRFHRIFQQNKRYITMGIYDAETKKYALFETINLIGNFRYSAQVVPPELEEMEQIVTA